MRLRCLVIQGSVTHALFLICSHSYAQAKIVVLLAECSTIFRSVPNIFYIFNKVGLYTVDLTNIGLFVENYRCYAAISPQYWCLVQPFRLRVPPFLKELCAFILQAASPRSERIDWVKKYSYGAYRYFTRNWPL